MKNIKFKTAIVALSLAAALALSATACSSKDDKKDDDDKKAKVEETEKETEETTTEETTTEETTEETSDADESDADISGMEMPEPAKPSDFEDERVQAFAQKANDAGLEIMKLEKDWVSGEEGMENYVEGFMATGGSMSVSASVDEDGNSDSSVSDDSSFKVYMCYLFSDSESAMGVFDENVEQMFSVYDESAYSIEETETGKVLKYDQDGVTAVMTLDGELFTMEEIIGS